MKLNEIKQLDEANKHSFIGRIQRHQELKKKVDQTWKDAVDAEKRGDEKGANRAFNKHVRYANLERPGTWRDVKEQDVSEGKHTQHYMDANKPSKDRQEAEAKKAEKKQTKWSEDPIAAATDRVYDKVAGMLGKKKQEVSEGEWGWDDPRYDRRPSGRNEDDEYEQYRQSKLDDQIEKKPMGFQVYDGTSRQYIGKVFRSQADAVRFRAVQPGHEHMSIQMVPLQESDSKNPHTSLWGRALYSALTKQMKTQHEETVLESDQRKVNAIRAQNEDYEKRAEATKNDIKKQHLLQMAKELRAKLPTRD